MKTQELLGKVHKIESFGTLDGPGIRTVIFLIGCDKRCAYCHNPDTWQESSDTIAISPQKMLEKVKRYKSYYGSNGGVTLSGGEPLLQHEFAKEFFKLCKDNGINTALDTSGISISKDIEEVLKYTDLVLLDIKMPDEARYEKYIKGKLSITLNFLQYLCENNIPTIIRYVVVTGINDSVQDFRKILSFLKGKRCVKDIELLPFHQMGKEKYKALNIEYSLKDLVPPDASKMGELNKIKEEEFYG